MQPCRSELRSNMPVADRFAYFDHAAVAPLPSTTAEAICQYAQQACHEGDTAWPTWSTQVAELRTLGAQLIHADPSEIALVPNTTHGIGLVAEGFPWQPGDNVVLPANEFPSNSLPWLGLRRKGVEVRRVPVEATGRLDWQALAEAIDGRTRILTLSWVGFSSGYRIDLERAVEIAHRHGALVMLDAIQGLGAFPIDVRACGIDFLCADGHKWMLGPEGAGLLYVQQGHLDLLTPLGLGWNSLASGAFDPESMELKATAARYEGGSTNMPGMLGLAASLRLLNQLGAGEPQSSVAVAIGENVAQLASALLDAGFTPHWPQALDEQSGILGVSWKEAELGSEKIYNAARKFCLREHVVLSVRGGRLRVSTHAYNNRADIERLVAALSEFRNHQQ